MSEDEPAGKVRLTDVCRVGQPPDIEVAWLKLRFADKPAGLGMVMASRALSSWMYRA